MSFINRVRLPVNFSKPQYKDNREVYVKANGVEVVLSNVVRKAYEGITDWLPEKIHDRLKIALAHDTVNIEGEKYIGGVSQEGDYNIEWPEFLDDPLGQAKFKVNITPFDASNNNCASCSEDFTQVVANDDDIGSVNEDTSYSIPVLDNDSICCYPAQITLVTFNTNYISSCVVNGNNIDIHTKTPLVTTSAAILVTYRVQCDNGLYDEADIIADVNGSISGCASPTNLAQTSITPFSVTLDWDTMPDAISYTWNLYLTPDYVTVIQTASTATSGATVNDLLPETNYRFCVQAVCASGNSIFVCIDFTTPANSGFCGSYRIETANIANGVILASYIDCNGDEQNITFLTFKNICALQTSPGAYVQINANKPITITYLGLC